MSITASSRRISSVAIVAVVAILFAVVIYQFWGVLQDTALVLRYHFGVDYGEGVVWQQVLLMFGPRMYSPSPDLPFIVFHYPPLYHIAVRGLMTLGLDPLFAGRVLSVAASSVSALCIGALILASIRDPHNTIKIAIAVTVALMFLCLPAVRTWGTFMRVDMLAVALGFLGTVVFVMSRCSRAGTIVALLLCVASVFTKQTQLPSGIAVFLVALACASHTAIVASLVAGGVGLAGAATLEFATGGFLKNIISYNVNPFTLARAADNIWQERETGPFLLVMLFGLAGVAVSFRRENGVAGLRGRDRRTIAISVVVVHFLLACFSGLEILKDGSSNNYFIDLFASGFILIGIVLCGVVTKPLLLSPLAVLLALSIANLRHHYYIPERLERAAVESEQLVERIAQADRPVSSDDMVLVMRAGKSLVFEPAIIRVLIAGGKWDPASLLAMIRDHGFAFALTNTSGSESGPLITQAIRDAYPRKEVFQRDLTANYPR